MKKLLLFPVVFLAACSITPPQPPFKVGDTLILSGTTKSGQALEQKYSLTEPGEYADDGWSYSVISIEDQFALGSVTVSDDRSDDSKFVTLEMLNLKLTDEKAEFMITLCFAFPHSPAWKSAEGFLVHDTLQNVLALKNQLGYRTDESGLRTLLASAGTCTITRQ